MAKITVENTEISVITYDNRDYICLTDMANAKEPYLYIRRVGEKMFASRGRIMKGNFHSRLAKFDFLLMERL